MSSTPARPPRKSSAVSSLLETFWVADVLILALVAFFIIIGGVTSLPVLITGIVLALLYAVHAVRRHNSHQELTMEERRMRERRGF